MHKNKNTLAFNLFLIVVFTFCNSCVDGDLYDLYDDSNVCAIQRNKTKGDYGSNGKRLVPGATPSNNPSYCKYYTLNCILNYVLGATPNSELVTSVCDEIEYNGIHSLRNALVAIVGAYWSEEAVSNVLYSGTYGQIKHPTSNTNYSEWDVIKTHKLKAFVDEWPDESHLFVVQATCTISKSEFEGKVDFDENKYEMYEGPALSSKSDPGSLKFHKNWVDCYIAGEEITALKNAFQNRNN